MNLKDKFLQLKTHFGIFNKYKYLFVFLTFFLIALILYFLFFNKKTEKQAEVFYQNLEGETIIASGFNNDLNGWAINSNDEQQVSFDSHIKNEGDFSLKLTSDGSAAQVIKTFELPQQGIFSIKFYDPGTNDVGGFLMARDENKYVMLGVHPTLAPNYYYYRTIDNSSTKGIFTGVKRSTGWHSFEIITTDRGTYARIDEVNLSMATALEGNQAIKPDMTKVSSLVLAINWAKKDKAIYFDDFKQTQITAFDQDMRGQALSYIDKYIEDYANSSRKFTTNFIDKDNEKIVGGQKDLSIKNEFKTPLRILSDSALVFAVKYRENEDPINLNRAINSLSEATKTFKTFDYQANCTDINVANCNTLHLQAYSYGLAAWLLWPKLPEELRQDIKSSLQRNAEFILDNVPPLSNNKDTFVNDSKGEENAGRAAILALEGLMFDNSNWQEKAKAYAFHSLTRKGDNNSYESISTNNVYSNYLLDNHNYHPHPQYTCVTIDMLGQGAQLYYKMNKDIPSEFKHNVEPVYRALKPYIDPIRYIFIGTNMPSSFGGRDDWNIDGTECINQYSYLNFLDSEKYHNDYIDIMMFHHLVKPDYLAFPQDSIPFWSAQNRYMTDNEIWLFNAIRAKKFAIEYLWYSNDMVLSSVSGEEAPISTPTPMPTPTPTPISTSTPMPTPTTSPVTTNLLPAIQCVYNFGSSSVEVPFVAVNDYVYQTNNTNQIKAGGKAEIMVFAPEDGYYQILALVKASSESSNSFYINIDHEPESDYMLWDIPVTGNTFANRYVSWRGDGDWQNSEFNPKIFGLAKGCHSLTIRGREANTLLDKIWLEKVN
ncbi:hypothetical protein GYA49_00400 [Candidatus Beckwithbacteria bacterium]|nr:hypothetical protein [Candidatus Beckwithbacteria bacterium]